MCHGCRWILCRTKATNEKKGRKNTSGMSNVYQQFTEHVQCRRFSSNGTVILEMIRRLETQTTNV